MRSRASERPSHIAEDGTPAQRVASNRHDSATPSRRGPPSARDLLSGQIGEHELLEMLQLGTTSGRGPPASGSSGTDEIDARNVANTNASRTSNMPRIPPVSRSTEPEGDMLFIPDVGQISRRQLQRLDAVLNGSDHGPYAAGLPDLTDMDSNQLARIEAALSSGILSAPVRQGNPAQSMRRRSAAQSSQQPQDGQAPAENSQRAGTVPVGRVTFLGPAPRSDSQAGSNQSASVDKNWKVDDTAFEKLTMKRSELPSEQECSICFQSIEDSAIALPCAKHSCASFFHRNCIRPWLERNPSCPLCRTNFPDVVSKLSPRCRGCGGAAASIEALLTAMGLAELLGQHQAMRFVLSHHGSAMDTVRTTLTADSDEGGDAATSLFIEALLQDSWTPATFSSDFSAAENARARLEGTDLAGTLGSGGRGEWQTAAALLGLPSDPDGAQDAPVQSNPRLREHGPSALAGSRQQAQPSAQRRQELRRSQASSVPNLAAEATRRSTLLRRGDQGWALRDTDADSDAQPRSTAFQRRESHASTVPPGRWFVESSPSQQTLTAPLPLRARPTEVSLRLPFARDASAARSAVRDAGGSTPTGQAGRSRIAPPPGGGWRPPSRGNAQAHTATAAGSSIVAGRRSTSVPQLGRHM